MVLQMRLDERLAHGQVCISWLRAIGATHIMVANDEVAGDAFQKNIMSMGIPGDVKSIFTTLDKAAGILKDPRSKPLRIFLIVKTPKDALKMVENVEDIREINIGNFGSVVKLDKESKRYIDASLYLDKDTIPIVKKIQQLVPNTYHQEIPGDSKAQLKL